MPLMRFRARGIDGGVTVRFEARDWRASRMEADQNREVGIHTGRDAVLPQPQVRRISTCNRAAPGRDL